MKKRVLTAVLAAVLLTGCSESGIIGISSSSSSSVQSSSSSVMSSSSSTQSGTSGGKTDEPDTATSDYNYNSNSDLGGIVITKYIGSKTDVTVPSEIDGEKVVKIGKRAFEGCNELTSVNLPNSVTEIGEGAFSSCTGLKSVEIPESVTEIGYGAFECCEGLESVSIPDSVTRISNWAFDDCNAVITYKGKTYTSENYGDLYAG